MLLQMQPVQRHAFEKYMLSIHGAVLQGARMSMRWLEPPNFQAGQFTSSLCQLRPMLSHPDSSNAEIAGNSATSQIAHRDVPTDRIWCWPDALRLHRQQQQLCPRLHSISLSSPPALKQMWMALFV